jgi:hypothetical protein
MYKRTDFFYEMAPGENMGFFPAQAEAIVYNYFRKYQNIHYKERVPKRNIDPKEIEEFVKKQKEKKDNKIQPKELVENKLNENLDQNIKVQENKEQIKLEQVSNEKIVNSSQNLQNNNSTTSNTSTTNIKQQTYKTQPISTYNGDSCDNYNWSQGVRDVTIQISLPEGTTKKMVISITKSFSSK